MTLLFSVLDQPEGEGGKLFAVDCTALCLLVAGNHLNLVHCKHLSPAISLSGHTSHVAPVRMDELTEILRVDRNLKLETLREQAMHFDQISSINLLTVTVPPSIECFLKKAL